MKTKSVPAITLEITAIGAGGDGIGTHEGKSVYVAKTAPGDVIEAQIEHSNADGHQARLLAISTLSPDRVAPPCPHFERCGGCALQHISESSYRNWTIEKVRTTLSRAGVDVQQWGEPIFLAPSTRRRTTLAVTRSKGTVILGYYENRRHHIVDILTCLILEPELSAKIQAMRPYIAELLPEGKTADLMIQKIGEAYDLILTGPWRMKGEFTLVQLEALAALSNDLNIARISVREKEFSTPDIVLSRSAVTKRFGAINVALPPGAFLQASTEAERTLVSIVQHHAKGFQHAADLFSGCGTFAGSLMESGRVHAVDNGKDAIAALAATKHKTLTTECRDLFKEPLSSAELGKFDLVVMDPPRAGAMKQVENLAYLNVPKIIYVSCNPASFARDARILQDGGYVLSSLSIVDQFVWSAHAEIVGVFKPQTDGEKLQD